MGSETRGVTNMGKSQRGRQRALEYWMRQGMVSLYKEDEREVGGGC